MEAHLKVRTKGLRNKSNTIKIIYGIPPENAEEMDNYVFFIKELLS